MIDRLTVIYYTCNQEEEAFEKIIQKSLLNVIGDTPLISVSHKPINFGKNICVGNIGASDMNIFRQLLMGCEAATTPLVATAEADCLYPPSGYFDFKPVKEDMAYRYTNLWFIYRKKAFYYKKDYSLCAQLSGREYLIKYLKRRILNGFSDRRKDILPWKDCWKNIDSDIPCVSIKSGNSMRSVSGRNKGIEPTQTLPHWGNIEDLKKRLWT